MVVLGLAMAAQTASAAAKPAPLAWADLIPAAAAQTVAVGMVAHGGLTGAETAAFDSNAVVSSLDGCAVRMAGFIVPLGFDGTMLYEFLLVPYVGACSRVPAPPPNQVVLVTSARGFRLTSLIDAVAVTGTLRVAAAHTELAEAGYRLTADTVEAFRP